MANNAYTQQALAISPSFRTRVRDALGKVAWSVLEESTAVENHTIRANYARNVLANLDGWVAQIAPWLVGRPNVAAFETGYDFIAGGVSTAAGDADLFAQLSSDWNHLSGV